jgi:hypothetical protein
MPSYEIAVTYTITHTGTFRVETEDAALAHTIAQGILDVAWQEDPQDPARVTDLLEGWNTQEKIEIDAVTEAPDDPRGEDL